MNIQWMDGRGSEGQFILEIMFSGGGLGYMKSPSYEKSCENYERFWKINPEIVGMTLYSSTGKVVASKTRMGVAA